MNNILKANQEFKELVMEYNAKSDELLNVLRLQGHDVDESSEPEQIIELQKVYKQKIAQLRKKYGLVQN